MAKRVFLTGATGNMGWAGFQELYKRKDHFQITLLARPSKKNIKKLKKYASDDSVNIVWGDLMSYEDVLKCVTRADYVLHVGGMVSPMADMFPAKTMKVNVTAANNIIKAVKAQPNRDEIGVVYIGSVAQTGQHTPPYHWGRCGDPIFTSILDYYSVSKCIAELAFSESGLKKWVSIRQSGMLYPDLLKKANDPIAYHVPFAGVLEWSTVEDSGRVLANVCEADVPETFWRKFYNLSSGPSFRLTNYEFEKLLLDTISCPPVEKIFDIKWFGTKNFHGQWYTDADELEEALHFREGVNAEDYFKRMKKELPWYFSLAKIAPAFPIKMFMKHVAKSQELGTLYWFNHGNEDRIKAHFGSREEAAKIPSWKEFDRSRPSDTPIILDHGFDESKPYGKLELEDMKKAAAFRGGKCLSEAMAQGDMDTPLEWECQFGHHFTMTPNAVLRGGHWCPECLPKYEGGKNTWKFDEIAKGNPFFAQMWKLVMVAMVFLVCSCNQPWRKYSDPVLKAYLKDSLEVMDTRSADVLKSAYMAEKLIEVNKNVPGWEGYPVKLYEYYTGKDIKINVPKKGKVYMLNPSPRQLSMWIITAVWEAKGCLDFQYINKLTNFIKWQSGAQFPVKGVVYEDMYTAGFYEPYVFKDGVTVYIADPKMFPEDKTCTEEQLDFYLNMTNADLKPNTGRYARISSTNRDMYYAAGGKVNVGDNEENRSQVWLDVVRLLYQQAWRSDKNELIIAWAKASL